MISSPKISHHAPKGLLLVTIRLAVHSVVYQQVTLSEDEQYRLRRRAAGLGVSVPRLLVESALSGTETPAHRRAWVAELFELRRLLATVANNVNQLAKVANTTGDLSAGERLARTLGEVDGLLVALRDWTGARR